MTSGWIRLFGVFGCVAAAGAFVFVFNAEAAVAFLYWIEYLSAMPGLSGAFLLFLAIVLFGVGCFVANWVASGFRRAE
tara:strand:- start:307 stop:540 length:234 start_codon:yes stop_codon:yes gene_type:complete